MNSREEEKGEKSRELTEEEKRKQVELIMMNMNIGYLMTTEQSNATNKYN